MASFSTALSGLQAASTALQVVGDNLANLNTQGFKTTDISFEDEINTASSSLQIGSGVGTSSTARSFTQGNIQTTNQPLDLAIQGNGFFIIQDQNYGTEYTRDGTFNLNSQGQLVTGTGALVQGWVAQGGAVNAAGAASSITVPPPTPRAPAATQNMSISANLNANAAVGNTFSTPVQVFDSLGNAHTLTVTFTNTAAGAWSYEVDIPSADLTGGKAGTVTSLGKGNVTFGANGVLTAPKPGAPGAVTNGTALADGAATLNINWNFYDAAGNPQLTGFGLASAASGTTQDGTASATVTGIAFQNGGMLVASYSDGSQQNLAQIALAGVANPATLVAKDNNNYITGPNTITPVIGTAGTGGRGNLISQSVEASNVDMATQFTNLIVFQQGYIANSKVLSTVNQMTQSLLAINP